MNKIISIIFGIAFGFVLTKSEVISWFRIQKMFNLEESYMYFVMGVAILVSIISVQLLKKVGVKSLNNEELNLNGKVLNKGTIIGGLIFGIGWAITGACPGPIFAQIGAGEYAAISTLGGAVSGAFFYNIIKNRLL